MAWPDNVNTTVVASFAAAAAILTAGGFNPTLTYTAFKGTTTQPPIASGVLNLGFGAATHRAEAGWGTVPTTGGLFAGRDNNYAGGFTANAVASNFYWTFTHPNINYSNGGGGGNQSSGMTQRWG